MLSSRHQRKYRSPGDVRAEMLAREASLFFLSSFLSQIRKRVMTVMTSCASAALFGMGRHQPS